MTSRNKVTEVKRKKKWKRKKRKEEKRTERIFVLKKKGWKETSAQGRRTVGASDRSIDVSQETNLNAQEAKKDGVEAL